MRARAGTTLLMGILLTVAGCAASADGDAARQLRGGTDLILREEILAANRGTAYEVIEALRPQWLRMRSEQSVLRQEAIQVYMDDVRYGDLEALKTVSARDVFLMQRYTSTAASQRWGPGHSEGVIWLSTSPGINRQ